jgi:CubicO group peptidase (beta-lactamase class C family)
MRRAKRARCVDRVTIDGVCNPRFERVRSAFAKNFDSGADVGASVAVTIDGKFVVDLWGGFRDPARTAPWERDTIVATASTTKTMTALCALILADRGELDLDVPAARYWREFAANGKSEITTAQMLGHTAALPGWTEPMAPSDLCDWEKSTTLLARQSPWWAPGTASGYHASTQGYLVGEVVRRITGQTVGQFFRSEIARPLGADYHIGLAPEHDVRMALSISAPKDAEPVPQPRTIASRVATNPSLDEITDWVAFFRAEIPAGNGVGNARSVALIQSILACGGEARGRRFLSRAGCERALVQQSDGVDLVFAAPVKFATGYALELGALKFGRGRSCFWGGSGGSLIVIDFEARMTIAYVMNRMIGAPFGDPRNTRIVKAVYASLADGSAIPT